MSKRDCPMCRDYLALGERCVHETSEQREDDARAEVERVRAEERSAIVAWLRSTRWRRPIPLCQECFKARAYSKNWTDATDEMCEVSEAIEQGEHLPKQAP